MAVKGPGAAAAASPVPGVGVGAEPGAYNDVDLGGTSATPLAPDHPYQPTTVPDVKRRGGGGAGGGAGGRHSGACPGPLGFLLSPPGILKLLQMLLSLVAFICVEAVGACSRCSAVYFFEFVSCTAFLGGLTLITVLATSLQQRISLINWVLMDHIFTLLCTVFLFIASVVLAALNDGLGPDIAAVVFGFLAFFAWAWGAGLVASAWRRAPPPWRGGGGGASGVGGASGQEYRRTRSESRAGDKGPDDPLTV
uniref:CKLF-like MARVEL transmembrane domain-containing protein 4 isoform X1 n=1 Tax=Petromyzon marinus TaxID=7757 RepID=A0AAJ7UEQ6_PETMA|nr:CKLF-like MARVEL transmembrane domain-containing protein 4 isoform X1 [Petromyzon marinus]XP_032834926.1 CKLF-like MARVEL transmembrane domain-containing protein 4 isoform X2 [Petromyzon marinus]XP_032834927.1 CKLF-like MARVEL transmembrane domain-containing protein 4 isoform X1 [Petromyzon marinus]